MQRIVILLLWASLAACAADTTSPSTLGATSPSAPQRALKMGNPASILASAFVNAAALAGSNAYAACKAVFYDDPPKVPDRDIVPLCERKGNQVFFASGYSEKDQRSIWSAYRLTAAMVQRIDDSDLDRSGYGFKKNVTLDTLQVRQPGDYAHRDEGITLEIYPAGEAHSASESSVLLGFEVADVDAALSTAVSNDYTIVKPPQTTSTGTRMIVLDPDGRRVFIFAAGNGVKSGARHLRGGAQTAGVQA